VTSVASDTSQNARLRGVGALALAVLGIGSWWVVSDMAQARTGRDWTRCSKTHGNAAAREAGLMRALDHDRFLARRVFVGVKPSTIYRRPGVSLCGDFDGDGHTDRALLYQCCTVSSPAPWLVLRRRSSHWRIAYKRLHDTTFSLKPSGRRLVTVEPKYSDSDSFCCPSRLKVGTLRWTGRSFRRVFRIEETLSTDSRTRRTVIHLAPGDNLYKPKSFCPDNRTCLTRLRWKTWSSSRAKATGHGKSCAPGGAVCTRGSISIVYLRPRRTCGHRTFTRFSLRFQGYTTHGRLTRCVGWIT
jgi:hypothetical protein